MIKRIYTICLVLTTVMLGGNTKMLAQDTAKADTTVVLPNDSVLQAVLVPDTASRHMSFEQYEAYSDSIYRSRYPEPEFVEISEEEANRLSQNSTQPLRDQESVYNNNDVPNSVSINTNYEVGQIEIESGTSPSGARTYNVPIKVFDANGVFAPTVSLTYNSQGGYGAAGKGWDVGGIQIITRGSCTKYYDDQSSPVSMTTDDAFFLNGVRLLRISTSDYIYETEQGHIKVKGIVNNNDFSTFYVYYPNGWKGEFGLSANLEYPIQKLTNEKGQIIYYNYTYEGSHFFISQILYASGMGSGSINFTYDNNRTDYVRGYMANKSLDSHKLLKSIASSFGGSSLGTYTLSHTTDDGSTLLTQIGYSANGSTLNPLKFYYGKNNNMTRSYAVDSTHVTYGYNVAARGLLSAVRGRINYRGGDDAIAYYPYNNPYYYGITPYGYPRILNNYDSNKDIYIYSGLNDYISTPTPVLKNGNGFIEVLFADIDGQLNESIIKVNNTASSSYETLAFRIYKHSALGIIPSDSCFIRLYTSYHAPITGQNSVQPKYYFTGDFNGDGRMEIMAVSANDPFNDGNHPSKCYIFDLTGRRTIYQGNLLTFTKVLESNSTTAQDAENSSDKLLTIDVDGDGKTELCHFHSNGMDIYTFDKNGDVLTARQMYTTTFLSRNSLTNRFYSCGDFNGDGLADIIVSPSKLSGGTNWSIYASKGNGGFVNQSVSGPTVFTTISSDYCVRDIDGDGICDLAEISGAYLYTYLVKNNTITTDAIATLPDDKCTVLPVSINSSTLSHQFIAINGYTPALYSYSYDKQRAHALTGMANSLGVVEKNYYYTIRPAANNTDGIYNLSYYCDSTNYAVFNGPLMLLAGNEVFVDGTSMDVNKFFYNTGVIHNQGLGFRGFNKVSSQNKRGQYSHWFYNPQSYGVLQSENTPTSVTTFTNSVSVDANKILTSQVTGKTVNDLLKGTTATTSYTYDTYGNVLTENMQTDGNISVNKYNTYYNYTDINTKYRLGLPHLTETETARNYSSHYEATSVDSYNDFFQPLTVVNSINGFTSKTTVMTYNNDGNMTSKSIDLYSSCTPRTTTYQYDAYKRLQKIIDPIGVYKQFTYQSDGKLASTQTYTGTTTYTYDNLSRLVSEHRPDTTDVSTAYAWTTSGGRYSVTRTETGQPTTATFYDALNRETQTTRKLFNNSTSVVRKTYDNYGRLLQESLPYYNGSSNTLWNTYYYDPYDRLTQLNEPGGRTTTYSYNNLSITTNDGTAQKTTTYDALGAVVSVTDPAGTVSYTLNGAGKPLSITAPGDVTTTFYYNVQGQLAVVNDPSQGSTQYTHDVFGNLILVQEANNATTHYYYDDDCRLTSKTVGDLTTTYTYDNNLNKLTSAVSSNGTSKVYTYDALGRMSSFKETGADSKWLKKDYTYAGGRIASVAYTSSQSGLLATENYTYVNGYLKKVALSDGTVIFQLNSTNQFGQPTNVTTGNMTRTYGYNSYGLPTLRKVQSSSTIYQNVSYTFNSQTGNLTSRTDNKNSLTETFSYDNLRRLTSFGGNSVNYDVKGNITTMGDVGTFMYDSYDKPYAVSDVWLTNNGISLGAQDVTYTAFHRPATVSENGNEYTFTYNGDYERVAMETTEGDHAGRIRYYLGGQYEMETQPSSYTKEYLYLGGDYYSAPAVLMKIGTTNNVFHIIRDHLGSINTVVHSTGAVTVQNVSYDAWGRMRNPQTGALYTLQNMPNLFLGRGYCGHEHISGTGLINMNARLYDPLIGRFLSPDPYVQEAWNSQNYNRYSYCLNNPLIYKDEDGEWLFFLGIAAIGDGIRNLAKHGFNVSQYNWTKTINAWRIDVGMFRGNFMQIVNKWTWGFSLSYYGNRLAHGLNMIGRVRNVTDLDGMLALDGVTINGAAFTIGHYSFGPKGYEATWQDHAFVHEYGHYMQGQLLGPLYIQYVAVPSMLSKWHIIPGNHKTRWYEIDASRRAAQYFDRKYGRGNAYYDSSKPEFFFDINSFIAGGNSPYINPRRNSTSQGYNNPITGTKFNFWDFYASFIFL